MKTAVRVGKDFLFTCLFLFWAESLSPKAPFDFLHVLQNRPWSRVPMRVCFFQHQAILRHQLGVLLLCSIPTVSTWKQVGLHPTRLPSPTTSEASSTSRLSPVFLKMSTDHRSQDPLLGSVNLLEQLTGFRGTSTGKLPETCRPSCFLWRLHHMSLVH